jgi:NADH-quinone oxidoreductase subunit M
MGFPALTSVWLVPVMASLLLLLIPKNNIRVIRWTALVASLISLVLVALITFRFDVSKGGQRQFGEIFDLVPALHIQYNLGLDGINLVLIILNAVILFTGVLVSWNVVHRTKEFFVLLLLLGGGVFGVFLSWDLYLFFVFYEIAVLPMYLLIGIWGTGPKHYSAMKLTLMLMGGSAFVLLGILALYFGAGAHTLDIQVLAEAQFSPQFQKIWFPVLFLGFGVLGALWPLHTWSPDGHASAPTAVSMLHAGVLMKLGAYGCLRIAIFLLPEGAKVWAHALAFLCLINVVYGAIGAASQKDLKYVTAYSSVSHMGIVLLGLATLGSMGINGAVMQMFAHGILTGAFFALIGMIYGRTHTRDITQMGGLAKVIPYLAVAYIITGLAGLGLPGLSSFPAELLVFLGAFLEGDAFIKFVAIIAVTSIIFTAVYVLGVIQKIFYGPLSENAKNLTDAGWLEKTALGILIFFMVAVGVYPFWMLKVIDSAVVPIVKQLGGLP